MIGTDHGLASAETRSAFSLPAEVRESVLSLARAKLGATGVVLLATCNRTELWVSFDGVPCPERNLDEGGRPLPDDVLLRTMCDMHMVCPEEYARYFVCRNGDAAVDHLFQVACGFRSAIMAEDQIVSQVKQAIAYSREIGIADSILEVLFRQAITAAKQVKSGVRFSRAYATAVDRALELAAREGVDLSHSKCMVIGNGAYGRLAAQSLVEQGAEVIVTVRQYTHGHVVVPAGCTGVPYSDRYKLAGDCDVIMSATTSPHYTLTREEFEDARGGSHGILLFDLAIPNDIDPSIGELDGCRLNNIDDFTSEIGEQNAEALVAAQRMLAAGIDEFWDWVHRRETMAHVRPPASSLFPLFVDLSEKKAVFVGGGTIALRRVRTLLPFVGDIVMYAPEFTPDLEQFAADGAITLVRKPYDSSVLDGADIVFACTNSNEVNDEVWSECKRRGVLVNVSSDRYKCDFYFPGVAQHENLVVGVSAGGKDHRRVRQTRARIEEILRKECK